MIQNQALKFKTQNLNKQKQRQTLLVKRGRKRIGMHEESVLKRLFTEGERRKKHNEW